MGRTFANFLIPASAYENMEKSIINRDAEYQYFEGMAFTTTWTKIQHAIEKETKDQIQIWKDCKNMYGQKDLIHKLNDQKSQYESVEVQIWRELVKELARQENVPKEKLKSYPKNYPVGGSSKEKVVVWDWLMFYQIVQKANARGGFATLDSQSQTYCVLKSQEMYDYLKNIPQIAVRLSRKDWEKGAKTNFYDPDDDEKMAILEKAMEESLLKNSKSKKSIDSIVIEAIKTEVERLFAQSFLGSKNSDKYIDIALENLGSIKRNIKSANSGYKILHDELRQWAFSFGKELNNQIRQDMLTFNNTKTDKNKKTKDKILQEPIKISMKNDNNIFFTLQMTGETKDEEGINELAENFTENILKFFKKIPVNYLNVKIAGQNKKFRISKEAKEQIANLPTGVITRRIIESYLNKNGKSLKSNQIISGVLGELSAHYHLSVFNIEAAASTGGKQQMYDKAGKVKFVTSASEEEKVGGFRSSGQAFSDMLFSMNMGEKKLNIGINIKNYVTNENHFTLMSAQTEGMDLNSVYLQRYLSTKEINLLKFVQANNALLSKYSDYSHFSPDLKTMASTIMENNVAKLLRIEGQGSETINYIIAANGHYIPASCIFDYAIQKLQKNEERMNAVLFEIKNANLFPYETRKMSSASINQENSNTQINSTEDLNTDILKIDELTRRYQSLIYKLKEFEVSVGQLLK